MTTRERFWVGLALIMMSCAVAAGTCDVLLDEPEIAKWIGIVACSLLAVVLGFIGITAFLHALILSWRETNE